MCQHNDNYFNVLNCNELQLDILEDLTGSLEHFPGIESDCTEKCKKKMIEIAQITLKQYSDMVVGYFKDAKLGISERNGCDIVCYISYCQDKGVGSDKGFVEMVEKAMNVKIVDGEVVHLNPDPVDSEEYESESDSESESKTDKK